MSIATYQKIQTKQTPQTKPIFGEQQVKNNAGGYVYALDIWATFQRFLILGSEGGTYYVGEDKLTADGANNTIACVMADGKRAVDLIVTISDSGRAPKNDPAIFALALAASISKDADVRAYALAAMPKVCRIPTHLFHFVTFLKQMRGFGPSVRKALANWYTSMPVDKLAYEVVKYQSRDGWSNRDVWRQAHPGEFGWKRVDPAVHAVYRWALGLTLGAREVNRNKVIKRYPAINAEYPAIIQAFEAAKKAGDADEIVKLILNGPKGAKLSREMLPTEALTYPDVWSALLDTGMPYTALIRNLGNMSKIGILAPLSNASRTVCAQLRDGDALKKARIHPIGLLIALKTYQSGHGLKGSGAWTPVPAVIDALNDAFYLSFGLIEPTGKRILYGLDVSGSMSSACGGLPISCAEGAAAMALASAKVEDEYYIMGFADRFRDLGITPKMDLAAVLKKTAMNNFGSTDCSVPMTWAESHKIKADAFVVITDNETYAGKVHPSQALRSYRQKTGIEAKEIVMGMTATPFTIADPKDPLTLDVVGFDSATPQVLSEFIRGI